MAKEIITSGEYSHSLAYHDEGPCEQHTSCYLGMTVGTYRISHLVERYVKVYEGTYCTECGSVEHTMNTLKGELTEDSR